MPEPDITRPKNRCAHYFVCLSWAIWVAILAQPVAGRARLDLSQTQPEPAPSSTSQQPKPDASAVPAAQQTQPESVPPQPNQPQSAQPSSTQPESRQPQTSDDNGTFVIRKDVDEVLLHATVVDDKQRIVTNLDKTAFSVFEDGKPQTSRRYSGCDGDPDR
jgi:hypothetical protein